MACACKRKGANFQKSTAKDIQKTIDLGEDDVYSCHGGKTEADVKLSAEAKRRYPYHTECKNQKTLRIPSWIRQSEADAATGMEPTVVFKLPGGRKKYIILAFSHWLTLHKFEPIQGC